ncbi:Cobyrinic acid ac-diamide synthase [Spirochaeta thermophila DSM 6578]|uniref:Cobyrinic acid ac-diamide synthase n=1 Tax=Winmispira thermophila (strain ATCC 700085 / DSM 6578 / Z-1203) TaxID=869211 RepID=G0GBG5_WINT7|nr:P-loop NTPase [Spirochaeta thermophila]AEJ60324.1 Cobyrinic acid ac-diamide synthase [Spirochaeta thermophila DSM 6578]
MHIFPIASGKGGVGKSLIATNLAIALAQAGKEVVLVDLDLGGSNLHLMLGIPAPRGIGSFLTTPGLSFQDIVRPTQYERLRFVPGDAEIPGVANLTAGQKKKILSHLRKLHADYLIIDLGAGTHINTLDFFLMSNNGIIVTTPTPTATVNAYLFLKNVIFRLLYLSCKRGSEGYHYLKRLEKEGKAFQELYLPKLAELIKEVDPESYEQFTRSLSSFHPRLILNMLEQPQDTVRAQRLRRSCQQYLGIDIEHLGIIYRDDLQDIALSSKLPILVYKPDSVLSQAVYRIADKLLQIGEEETSLLDIEEIDESFQEADVEAQIDFENKMEYVEELLHTGTLTMGDLVETVKMQQLEINRLRKENQFLKAQLVKAMQNGFLPETRGE